MNCERVRESLQEYVDGEVRNAVEKAEIEAHLANCQECRASLKRLQKFTTTVVQTMRPLRPSGDFSSKVLATARNRPASSALDLSGGERSYPLWPWLAGAAVIVLIGLYLLLGSRRAAIGTVVAHRDRVKVLQYEGGEFREAAGSGKLHAGCQIDVPEEGAPYPAIDLDSGRLTLRGPLRATLSVRDGEAVMTFAGASGRVYFDTRGQGKRPMEIEVNRVHVRMDSRGKTTPDAAVDVSVAPTGAVTCAVRTGSAQLFGPGAEKPVVVAEGFQVTWPQEGPPGKVVAAPLDAFQWAAGE